MEGEMSDSPENPHPQGQPSGAAAVPSSAKVVVVGAGIVGNCLVGHLADLGWEDIVLLDKGPLPNPGGSTGHASNFIFPVDHNKEMAFLTLESQKQYEALGLNTTCGGIEVARTEERMEELRRRMTSAVCWGVEAELLTPAQVKEKVPFINADILLGGFYTPSVSVVDSLETGTVMRKRAQDKGVLQVFANTEVLDVEVSDGKVVAVVTDKGRIEAGRRGHCLRGVEPEDRRDGGGDDSLHAGRAPNG